MPLLRSKEENEKARKLHAIVMSGLSGEERNRGWPIVFTQKGIRVSYTNKGQFVKASDNKAKTLKYVVLFGTTTRLFLGALQGL